MLHSSPPLLRRIRPILRSLAAAALLVCGLVATQGGPPNPPGYAAGFPHLFPRTTDTRPREGALVTADLDHDGRTVLVASVPAGLVTVVGAEGRVRPGWPRRTTGFPQPAWPARKPGIGDLDGDGHDEIVTCVTAGPPPRRAFLAAWRADGTDVPGWPVELGVTGAGWGCAPGATVVADLDGDGRAEVLRAEGDAVYALDGAGMPLPGWPWLAPPDALGRARPINADPSVTDLDGDGRREIVVVESGYEPRLFVLDADGVPIAPFPLRLAQVVDRQAPSTVDLDRDGRSEIVQATLPFMGTAFSLAPPPALDRAGGLDFIRLDRMTADRLGLDGAGVERAPEPAPPLVPAALLALRLDGSAAPGWPRFLGDGAAAGAVVADLDGDGSPDVLQGDSDRIDAYDGEGHALRGYPLTVRGLPRGAEARLDTRWIVTDLDADGRVDLLRISGFLESGLASLRVIGLQVPGADPRGYPFTVDGVLPSSDAVAIDLNGDRVPEVAVLASEGTNGGWRLLAWDVGSGRPR